MTALAHYTQAKTHLNALESVLLNTFGEARTALQLELVKLQLEAGRLALDLGAAPSAPKPLEKTLSEPTPTPAKSSKPEPYDHSAVPEGKRISEKQLKFLFGLGKSLFELSGTKLESRLLEEASKVLGKSVAYLNQLHAKDGSTLLEQLKRDAEAAGVQVGGVR